MPITRLPLWKKNQTPAEMFDMLKTAAEANPERYQHVIVSVMGKGETPLNWHTFGDMTVAYGVGLLELTKMDIVSTAQSSATIDQ
jgi:hypothetical protein